MYGKVRLTVHSSEPLKSESFDVEINAFHIHVFNREGQEVFGRDTGKNDALWYDEKHQGITDALSQLEKALKNALDL
jgi:hypothetical protein